MSVEHTNLVWKHSRCEGSARLVMLAIADYTDPQGTCRSSVPKIAEMVLMSPRAVHDLIKKAESLGELRIDRRPGRPSSYRITIADSAWVNPGSTPEVPRQYPGNTPAVAASDDPRSKIQDPSKKEKQEKESPPTGPGPQTGNAFWDLTRRQRNELRDTDIQAYVDGMAAWEKFDPDAAWADKAMSADDFLEEAQHRQLVAST